MKRTFILSIFLFTTVMFLNSCCTCCKVAKTNSHKSHDIQGLWEGKYFVKGFEHINIADGTGFYFAISIYPDGTLSYKSKGRENENNLAYITFADGNWKLDGDIFTFNVTTVNIQGNDSQHTQYGTLVYNSKDNSLKGTISDSRISTSSIELWKVK